jgi:cobalamin biosynthesis Mg chelatase CobN
MRKTILLAGVLLALALPAGAAAAQIVPPGNSAAAQYTETIPTSQGEQNAQGPKKHVNPDDVIGSKKTKELEEQGPEGAAVAEFTAETAPTASSGGEESAGGNTDSKHGGAADGNGKADTDGNGRSNGKGAGDGEGSSEAGAGGAAAGGNGTGSGPSGSSAVGEVASQATGVSSGALGLWLPIVLVAVLAWAGFMVWRRREGPERAV